MAQQHGISANALAHPSRIRFSPRLKRLTRCQTFEAAAILPAIKWLLEGLSFVLNSTVSVICILICLSLISASHRPAGLLLGNLGFDH
jgi:hypothetical protein